MTDATASSTGPTDAAFDPDSLRALVFDYGNTLIEFSMAQIERCEGAFCQTLGELFGPPDLERFISIRRHQTTVVYTGEHRENTPASIVCELVEGLYDQTPSDEQVEQLVEARRRLFVDVIELDEQVLPLLDRLGQRYQLGLVSNYPCGTSIRASLDATGLAERFETIVVSGDVGYVKPHPLPFRTALDAMGVDPTEAAYIGDNWLGDIQGAKRLGMTAIHTTQYDTPEKFDRQHGDHDADLVITDLRELADHLLPPRVGG